MEMEWVGGGATGAGARTCLLDEVLVDPAAEVVPAIPPKQHSSRQCAYFVTGDRKG